MRRTRVAAFMILALTVLLVRPWEKQVEIGQAICDGNIFWSMVYAYHDGEINRVIYDGSGTTTPLLLAIENVMCPKFLPHVWAMVLVWFGADVNLPDHTGTTPLMMAVSNVDLASVRFLLRSGADINARDRYGETAGDRARRLDNQEINGLFE